MSESKSAIPRTWLRYLPGWLRSRLEGRDDLQRVIGNTGWQFGDHLLRMAVGLLVGIWLARYLGPADFGLLSYALAFYMIFSAFAQLGLDDIIVRDLVQKAGLKDEVLGTSFCLRLASGTISFLAALGTVQVLRPADGLSQWLVGIVALGTIFQAAGIIEFWFHSQVRAKYAVVAKSAAFLACSLLKIGLILAGAPLIMFAWAALLEVATGSLGLVLVYQWRGGRLGLWRCRWNRALRLLRDSWPLMLSSMVIMVYLRIDQVMLGEMAGNREVGIYSVAVRLSEVWYFIPSALYWSLFPGIVAARQQNEALFYDRLQQLYNLAALSGYLVAVPITLAAHWLVPLLFGEAYAAGGLMLAVLIWSNLFTGLEMARSGFLTAMNWTRLYLATVLLGCGLNILLNLLLIPRFGGMGAVTASLAAYWLAAHGSCFPFRPLYRTGRMLTRALVYPKVW